MNNLQAILLASAFFGPPQPGEIPVRIIVLEGGRHCEILQSEWDAEWNRDWRLIRLKHEILNHYDVRIVNYADSFGPSFVPAVRIGYSRVERLPIGSFAASGQALTGLHRLLMQARTETKPRQLRFRDFGLSADFIRSVQEDSLPLFSEPESSALVETP